MEQNAINASPVSSPNVAIGVSSRIFYKVTSLPQHGETERKVLAVQR